MEETQKNKKLKERTETTKKVFLKKGKTSVLQKISSLTRY